MKQILAWIFFLPTLAGAQSFIGTQKVMDPNRSIFSFMGHTVEITKDYAFVAAPESPFDTAGVNPIGTAGIVLVYQRNSAGHWNLVQKLQSPNRNNVAQFGWSMAAEDSLLVVGARGEWVGFPAGGAAHVFKLRNGRWVHDQRIIPTDTAFQGRFGESVDIAYPHIVVGAEKNDLDSTNSNALFDAGAAYVFEKTAGVWQQTDKLSPSQGRVSTAYFGKDVSISGDRILVGSPEAWLAKPSGGYLYTFGLAYEYAKQANGEWNEVSMLIDTLGNSIGGFFGEQVVLTDSLAFISAPSRFVDTTLSAGQVVVMKRNSTGWEAIQYLSVQEPFINDNFGYRLDYDQGNLLVGVPAQSHELNYLNPITAAGAAYWFKTAPQSDSLYEVQKILPQDRILPNSTFDFFGSDIAIDGVNILIGARNDDDDTLNLTQTNAAGTAYFFDSICLVTYDSLSVELCAGDSINFGGNYLSAPGTYSQTLQGSNGCDSLLYLNITLLPFTTTSISINGCGPTILPSGRVINISGNYQDTLTSVSLCDSILDISASITTVDTAVLLDATNQRLIALANNASFRWLDCEDNYAVIPGIVDDTVGFIPGTYAVEITQNSCVDTSRCVVLRTSNTASREIDLQWSIYPNPSSGEIKIEVSKNIPISSLRVFSIDMRMITEIRQPDLSKQIVLPLKPGQYLISLSTATGSTRSIVHIVD